MSPQWQLYSIHTYILICTYVQKIVQNSYETNECKIYSSSLLVNEIIAGLITALHSFIFSLFGHSNWKYQVWNIPSPTEFSNGGYRIENLRNWSILNPFEQLIVASAAVFAVPNAQRTINLTPKLSTPTRQIFSVSMSPHHISGRECWVCLVFFHRKRILLLNNLLSAKLHLLARVILRGILRLTLLFVLLLVSR